MSRLAILVSSAVALCAGTGPGALAQQAETRSVLGAAGTTYVQPTFGDLHFTVGEVAVSRLEEGLSVSEGFHQVYATQLLVSAIGDPRALGIDVEVFPNPTAEYVNVRLAAPVEGQVVVTDATGRQVDAQQLAGSTQHQLNLSNYPAGTYVLTVRDAASRRASSFQVVKVYR